MPTYNDDDSENRERLVTENLNSEIAPHWTESWLVGANGLHHSPNGIEWSTAGGGGHLVTDLIRQPTRLVCATMAGIWQVERDSPQWLQLHDETLTEVLGIAPTDGDPGVVAVSPYGLALGRPDKHGAKRWDSHAAGLSLNERFSNTILAHPKTSSSWVVGTETGVLIYASIEDRWQRTDLSGLPCRALLQAHDCLWAGTDGGGVWRSTDGFQWQRAGTGLDRDSVFSLSATMDQVLVGTLQGICVGDGDSPWHRNGPSLLVSAIASCAGDGTWLAGATPGGLWRSDDAGVHWRQVGTFDSVRAILPPERTA